MVEMLNVLECGLLAKPNCKLNSLLENWLAFFPTVVMAEEA